MPEYDAVIIGAGPNGLAAGIKLAQEGFSVLILEAKEEAGGGLRSGETTLPGFIHDHCSTIHPLAKFSPFFRTLPLEKYGLKWITPPISLAHPLGNGTAAVLTSSIEETALSLDEDYKIYINLMNRLVNGWHKSADNFLGPFRFPSHPFNAARFGYYALQPLTSFIKQFRTEKTKALFAGMAAHSFMPLNKILTASFGITLAVLGHTAGWVFPEGGANKIAAALYNYFISLGGKVKLNYNVASLNDIPACRVILFDTSPAALIRIAGNKMSHSYIAKIRKFKAAPAAYKMDFAVSEAVPFKAKGCLNAGTIHLGGKAENIIDAERRMFYGAPSDNPYMLLAQTSKFDRSRAPAGKHTVWTYTHVPNGFTGDMTETMIRQIEKYAPGFRDTVIEQKVTTPADFEIFNSNFIGGDIMGGLQDWTQFFTRPVVKYNPYSTPAENIFLCSASTPPGGGVHGMCGFNAALKAIEHLEKGEK